MGVEEEEECIPPGSPVWSGPAMDSNSSPEMGEETWLSPTWISIRYEYDYWGRRTCFTNILVST